MNTLQKGVAKGVAEGIEKGRLESLRESILRLVRRSFPNAPETEVTKYLNSIHDTD